MPCSRRYRRNSPMRTRDRNRLGKLFGRAVTSCIKLSTYEHRQKTMSNQRQNSIPETFTHTKLFEIIWRVTTSHAAWPYGHSRNFIKLFSKCGLQVRRKILRNQQIEISKIVFRMFSVFVLKNACVTPNFEAQKSGLI